MHVLMACVGSAGDVHPFIAIGLALQRRGHSVQLLTSPYFQERIEGAGLGFIPMGTLAAFEQVVRNPHAWDRLRGFGVLSRALAPQLAPAYATLKAHIRAGETVLVGSTLAFPVRVAQDNLGVPAATVHLSPAVLFSAVEPAAWPGFEWLPHLPRALARGMQRLVEWAGIDPMVKPMVNRLRASLDLPPVRRIMSRWANSPQRVICAWPSTYAPLPEDAPPNSVCTGFARWSVPGSTRLDVRLEAFLQAGSPPIVFTPGSAMAQGRRFFERALAASDVLQRRAVLVTPFRDQLPAKLPRFAFHARYVPYELLMPRAAAIVHHGGIGTCAQAMSAGTPQLITPFSHDQFDNALRARRLGVALSLSPQARPARWVKMLASLLDDPVIAQRCREQALLAACEPSGAAHAADWIEALGRG